MTAALILAGAAPIAAQSTLWGSISGRVTTPLGQSVPQALVTLTRLGGGAGHDEVTNIAGGFTFSLVRPGTYEIRVELLGFRPLVAHPISLDGGSARQVDLRLVEASPPVTGVDTLILAATSADRLRPGAVHMGSVEVNDLPDRFADLSSIVALAEHADPSLGLQGLPGYTTAVIADGVPVYRAPHPVAAAEELANPAFPRSLLSGVTVYPGGTDLEWSGSSGGHVVLTTRTGTRASGLEADAAWSGGPLWSSSELSIDGPSLTTFRGGVRGTVEVSPDTSQIVLGAEVMQVETPLVARAGETLAADLAGLDPDLIASLSSASTERVSQYSALARADIQRGSSSRVFLRGAAAYVNREFDGPGTLTLARSPALAEESIDASVAGGLIFEYDTALQFELRAGFSLSNRTFERPENGQAAAFLAGNGAALGFASGAAGESRRSDFVVLPMAYYRRWGGLWKFGVSARLTTHTLASESPGEFFFSDAAAVVSAQGFAQSVTAEEASFTAGEVGVFTQYDVELSPAFDVTLGVRYDFEPLPRSDVSLNTAWAQATGLLNDSIPTSLQQISFHSTLTWEPSNDGATKVVAAAAMYHGDVDSRVLGEALARDVAATSIRYAGTGLTWPGTLPAGATARSTLTLLGPETRAPRTGDVSVQVAQRLTGPVSLHLGGSVRRTDFLMRRRNLNLPAAPVAVDPYGRDVFGTLQQDGAIVTATADDGRRFPNFNEVWAMDPDGWSEYRGVSAGLRYEGESASVSAAYTWSETTDNWIGAASGSFHGQLPPLLPQGDEWSEGVSDFDVRHRATATASTTVGFARLAATYRFRSGLPFTPGYRVGVDANGDGSARNDVAFVDEALLGSLLDDWSCLSDAASAFVDRNSCRGPSQHAVDARVSITLGQLRGRDIAVVVEGFNLIESEGGIVDDALLLVDPSGSTTTSGGTVTVPVVANPDFGQVLYPSSPGRTLRVGVSVR